MKKRMISFIIVAMMALQGAIPVTAELDCSLDLPVEENATEEDNISFSMDAEAESVNAEDIEYVEDTYFDEEGNPYSDSTIIEEETLEEEQIPETEELDSLPEEFNTDELITEELITEELITEELITEDLAISEEASEIEDDEVTLAGATSGKCGDNITWSWDGDGKLIISGTGKMWNWDYNFDTETSNVPWWELHEKIKRIIIKPGVTSIGNRAFYRCYGLTSVTIPDSVTSIGNAAFSSCIKLTSVKIPTSVTSIGYSAFFNSGLTSVAIPDSVTSIGHSAFARCTSLMGSVTIPDGVTIIGDSIFQSCTHLTTIIIPASVRSIGWFAFYDCYDLTNVMIPDSVTSIGGHAFSGCSSLTSMTIPDGVTNIEIDAFNGCSSLTNVTIGDSVTSIGDRAFQGCALTSVTIWESVTNIGYRAFQECKNLTDVYYEGSEEEWNGITIGDSNDPLFNATIHYNINDTSDTTSVLSNWTWNFSNPTSIIPVSKYMMFFEDYSTAKHLQRDIDNGSKGHCAGMVLSASSVYKGFPSKPLWGAKNVLGAVNKYDYSSKTNSTAIDFIDYAHTFQYVPAFQREIDYNKSFLSDTSKLDGLRDAVFNFQHNKGEPVWIRIGFMSGGHALWGLGISEETEEETRIEVYDCNKPQEKCYIILEGKYGGYSGAKFIGSLNWSLDTIGNNISYVIQTQDFIDHFDRDFAGKQSILSIGKTITGNILIGSNPLLGGIWMLLENDIMDVVFIQSSNGVETSDNYSFWINNDEKVSFTDLSGNGEISLAAGQLEMTIDPSEGCDISMNLSQGEATFSNCEGDNISVKYELSTDYENSTVTTINGTSDGNSKTTQDASGNVIFTGLENCNITLNANKENANGTTTTTVLDGRLLSNLDPSKEYIVYEVQKEKLEIYEDVDENGSFETPINSTKLFKDVTDPSTFYFEPIYWAVDNGITTGFNDNTFRPTNNCNRAAVVTFLWRLAGKPDAGITNAFHDMTENNDFDHAITWALRRGITTGFIDNSFRPWTTCNRAAIVTFLWRYAGRPEPTSMASFSDMTGNEDFDKAISWAAENGITTGYNDGTFRPWNQCTRLAVVTFLYRYAHL